MPRGGQNQRPDGRQARAPGVGKTARRHDLEQPKTPGLHGSDLQQGDVQELEAGQRQIPIRQKPAPAARRPAAGGNNPRRSRAAQSSNGGGVPSPGDVARQRLGGTLNRNQARQAHQLIDGRPWLPILRQMANTPTTSGLLTSAYVAAGSEALRGSYRQPGLIELDVLDRAFDQGQ